MGTDTGSTDGKSPDGLSDEERAAVRERAAEVRKETRRGRGDKAAAQEREVLEKIEGMAEPDRAVARRVHALVAAHAPGLAPKLWYGQPAYARGGKVVCFFRSGHTDKERYSTFGFTPEARLDDGGLWPTSYAVTGLDERGERTLAALLRAAVD
ncbi:DUF1801 domain-containing protein [Streptomyces sp. JNUCC 64]